ncbi:MAG: hypothetical protein E3J64_06915 [Anaerolineales bacterium]|nr:MAG: hypothetical protein E3J64_06915 [Anaerolineales bacterium]
MNKRGFGLLLSLALVGAALGCGLGGTSADDPTATPIPSWKRFEGGGAELWLPESYEGGNIAEDVETVADTLRQLGPDFEQMAQLIEQNPDMYAIWAFDMHVGDLGFLTNVNVIREQVMSATTLDAHMDAALAQLPSQFQVTDREAATLGDLQAGRVIILFDIGGMQGAGLMYVAKDDNTMWVITYATSASEFDQRLSTFEESAGTFAILD